MRVPERSRETARKSLSEEQQQQFNALVESVAQWSQYFYGTKLISYVILAELVRDGWTKKG